MFSQEVLVKHGTKRTFVPLIILGLQLLEYLDTVVEELWRLQLRRLSFVVRAKVETGDAPQGDVLTWHRPWPSCPSVSFAGSRAARWAQRVREGSGCSARTIGGGV